MRWLWETVLKVMLNGKKVASTALPQMIRYNLPLPISADCSWSSSSCAQKCATGGFTPQITWNSCIKKLTPTPTRSPLTTWVPPCCPFRNWQTPARTRVCGAKPSMSCAKKISATFSQIGWFVTNSHHKDTFTGVSADPDLQALGQTAIHHVKQLHISSLLLVLCPFPAPLPWRDYVYVLCSTLLW